MSNIGMPISILSADINGDPDLLTWWHLCHADGTQVCVGEEVKTFRGELLAVVDGMPPHKQGSTGRVALSDGSLCFPGVCDLVWYDQTTMEEQTEGEFYAELERGYSRDR